MQDFFHSQNRFFLWSPICTTHAGALKLWWAVASGWGGLVLSGWGGLGCVLYCGFGRVLWTCVGLAWLVGRLVGLSCGWFVFLYSIIVYSISLMSSVISAMYDMIYFI